MQRNIYEIQLEAARVEREMAEIQMEFQAKINEKQLKLQQLNLEVKILTENFAQMQSDEAKAEVARMQNL